jgi:hypothetical protein
MDAPSARNRRRREFGEKAIDVGGWLDEGALFEVDLPECGEGRAPDDGVARRIARLKGQPSSDRRTSLPSSGARDPCAPARLQPRGPLRAKKSARLRRLFARGRRGELQRKEVTARVPIFPKLLRERSARSILVRRRADGREVVDGAHETPPKRARAGTLNGTI